MATGSILLTPPSAIMPDGSASNAAPAMQRAKSSATAPAPYFLQLAFDATTQEQCYWSFRMPADYASSPVAKIQYKMASATTGGVVFNVSLAAVTSGDAQDVDAKALATTNAVTVSAVPGTAGYLDEASVTLTNADSVAAGDFVVVFLARAAANGSDTATGDCEVVSLTILYTTT